MLGVGGLLGYEGQADRAWEGTDWTDQTDRADRTDWTALADQAGELAARMERTWLGRIRLIGQ